MVYIDILIYFCLMLLGDENVLAAEVVNSDTTSSKNVNTDEHLHLPLASVGATSMSNEFNGNTP